MSSRARVLVAEDDEVMRYTITLIVQEHYDLVGEASDGQSAVKLAGELHPDVILLDISLPGMNGFEVARRIREQMPAVRILLVSSHSNVAYAEEALRMGLDGYVLKGAALLQLPVAIDDALNRRFFRPA